MKYCILGSKTDACVQFTTILLAIHSLSMHQLSNEQQTKLPIILDSFYWHSYYHKHSYMQVWRVRVVENHEVPSKGYLNTKNRQMASIGTIFSSQKAAKFMTKVISQLCGKLQLAVWLSMGDRAIKKPPDHLQMSDKPQKQPTAKAVWATFIINSCMNCQLMYTAII